MGGKSLSPKFNRGELQMKKWAMLVFISCFSAWSQSEVKTSVFGDFRLRHEAIESEGVTGKDHYDHLRVRARLGVKSQVSDVLNTEVRLATGGGGTSTNQTFSGTKNYDVKVDRAFFKYSFIENALLRGGRTESPFLSVGENSMLLDSDLNFDGASLSYILNSNHMTYQLVLAHSILSENSTTTSTSTVYDTTLNSAQLAIRYASEVQTALLTLTAHSFNHVKNNSVIVAASGNSTTGTFYTYGYNVTSVGLEYGYKSEIPVTLFAEMATNGSVSQENKAVIYGIKVNKLKKKGDWMLMVDSRELEKDSTLGALTDSDSFAGGTNGRSLNTSVGYNLDDQVNLMVTHMTGETLIADGETALDRNRVQVDFGIKF